MSLHGSHPSLVAATPLRTERGTCPPIAGRGWGQGVEEWGGKKKKRRCEERPAPLMIEGRGASDERALSLKCFFHALSLPDFFFPMHSSSFPAKCDVSLFFCANMLVLGIVLGKKR